MADRQPQKEPAKCRVGKGICAPGWYVCVYIQDERVVFTHLFNTGDCAELFDYCNQEMIEAKVKLLLQMSLVLIWGMYIRIYATLSSC